MAQSHCFAIASDLFLLRALPRLIGLGLLIATAGCAGLPSLSVTIGRSGSYPGPYPAPPPPGYVGHPPYSGGCPQTASAVPRPAAPPPPRTALPPRPAPPAGQCSPIIGGCPRQ